MTTVARLLQSKGNDIYSVSPDTSVYDAIAVMAERNIGAVLVMEESKLSGIMSERDYARKVILKGKSSRETPARDIMTERVIYVHPDSTTDDCMALMTQHRIRHLPVLDGERVAGMISIGDVVRAQIADRDELIQHLQTYITGGR